MYCHFCGKPLPENAAFCPHCGKALDDSAPPQKEEDSNTIPSSEDAAPTQDSPASDHPATEPEHEQTGATGSQEGTQPTDEEIIGRNIPYYLTQFAKLRQGEKASFNWAAFFLTFYHAAYRGPWKIWFSFMKIPLIGLVAGAVLGIVGALSAQPGVIAASSVVLLVFCILWFVWMIRYGFAFNRLYLAYVEKQRQEAQPKPGPSGKRLGIAIAIVIVCCLLYSILSLATTMAVFGDLASGDSYEETLTLSDEVTEEPEEEPEPEPLPEETPDTQEESTAFSAAPPASASLEVVRYATNNGRITEVPPAAQVCKALEAMDYSGYLVITPGEVGGFFSPRNNVYTTQLYVDIYQAPWTYLQSIIMYYTYIDDESGPHNFSLDPDTMETYCSEEASYLTWDDYDVMNNADAQYYGDSPAPGVLWCDPDTGEWYLDGEPAVGGGLYWY